MKKDVEIWISVTAITGDCYHDVRSLVAAYGKLTKVFEVFGSTRGGSLPSEDRLAWTDVLAGAIADVGTAITLLTKEKDEIRMVLTVIKKILDRRNSGESDVGARLPHLRLISPLSTVVRSNRKEQVSPA